jgi:hypothetical protein
MEPLYTKATGYSSRPWPYMAYSSLFFGAVSFSKWASGQGYPPTTLAGVFISAIIYGPLLGLCLWGIIWFFRKIGQTKHRASR